LFAFSDKLGALYLLFVTHNKFYPVEKKKKKKKTQHTQKKREKERENKEKTKKRTCFLDKK